jgi:hypothetical protein
MASLEILLVGLLLISGSAGLAWLSWRQRSAGTIRVFGLALAIGGVALGMWLAIFAVTNPARLIKGYAIQELRSVGRAISMYIDDHGVYPDTLRALIDDGLLGIHDVQSVYVTRERADDVDYVYVHNMPLEAPSHWPLAFEREDVNDNGDRLVLFVSGDVRELETENVAELLKEFGRQFEARMGRPPVYSAQPEPR